MNHYIDAIKQDLTDAAALMYTLGQSLAEESSSATSKSTKSRYKAKSIAMIRRGNAILNDLKSLGGVTLISAETLKLIKSYRTSKHVRKAAFLLTIKHKLDRTLEMLQAIPTDYLPIQVGELIATASAPFFKPKKKAKKYAVTISTFRTPMVASLETDEVEEKEEESLNASEGSVNDEAAKTASDFVEEKDVKCASTKEAKQESHKDSPKTKVTEAKAEATEVKEAESASTPTNKVSLNDALFDALISGMDEQQAAYEAQDKLYTDETVASFTKKNWFERVFGL